MQIIQGKTRRQRVMERVLWDVLRDLLRERAEDGLLRASILDFRARLANRCKLFPDYTLLRASILDFKPKLGNRCMLFPVYALLCASILDFNPRLGNRCSTIVVAVENGPPATAVAATIFRARFKFLCSKEEWPAGYAIAAARKNGPPAD